MSNYIPIPLHGRQNKRKTSVPKENDSVASRGKNGRQRRRVQPKAIPKELPKGQQIMTNFFKISRYSMTYASMNILDDFRYFCVCLNTPDCFGIVLTLNDAISCEVSFVVVDKHMHPLVWKSLISGSDCTRERIPGVCVFSSMFVMANSQCY